MSAVHVYSKSLEIPWADHTEARAGTRGRVFDFGPPSNLKGHTEIHAFQRHAYRRGSRGDAGQRFDFFEKLAVEDRDLLRICKVTLWLRKREREDMIRAEAEV